ncbi:hypothetical protein J6590_070917 [Homalodisca vitripennis]|nr:hypothetical protein J6590_070917 [Homalodisca vitripennis]
MEVKEQKRNLQPNDESSQTPSSRSITIKGDSHTRHVAGMVMKPTGPGTSVSGKCKPGAKLLDIIRPAQTKHKFMRKPYTMSTRNNGQISDDQISVGVSQYDLHRRVEIMLHSLN